MKKIIIALFITMGSFQMANAVVAEDDAGGGNCRQLKRECKDAIREVDGHLNSLDRHFCRGIYHSCKMMEAMN